MSTYPIQQAVILAAGRGTRLAPLTDDRPKSLLPILGQPLLLRVLEQLRRAGIARFVVVTGPDLSRVQAAVSAALLEDAQVEWVVQPSPTGTVAALQRAFPLLSGPFLLTAVDNLTPVEHVRSLIAHHQAAPDHIATLSLLPATPAEIRQSADVLLDGDRVVFIAEKPAQPQGRYAAIMLYAFSPAIETYLPAVQPSHRGEREIVTALQLALTAGERIGATVTGWRLHLTRPLDLLHLNSWYLRQQGVAQVFSDLPSSAQVFPPVWIDPGVSVGEGVVLGPDVYLETGATVSEGARLRHAVVLAGGIVPPHVALYDIVLDRRRCFAAGSPEQIHAAHKE